MNLTESEQNTVFALALLAIVRKSRKAWEDGGTDELIDATMPGLYNEVRNILLEHLTAEQIAELAARELASSIAGVIREFCLASLAMRGEASMEHLIKATEKFCSEKLGREIKV